MSNTIWATGSDRPGMEYRITFDYDPVLVAAIKANVPGRLRAYDPTSRAWHIAPNAWSIIERVALRSGYRIDNAHTAPRRTAADGVEEYNTLHLLPSAPPEVVAAAYRALAKLHHPDAGGDTATMQRINTAYKRLSK
jgi:hypothetical protein